MYIINTLFVKKETVDLGVEGWGERCYSKFCVLVLPSCCNIPSSNKKREKKREEEMVSLFTDPAK